MLAQTVLMTTTKGHQLLGVGQKKQKGETVHAALVPAICQLPVRMVVSWCSRANPKSLSFAMPAESIRTLAGFRSVAIAVSGCRKAAENSEQ